MEDFLILRWTVTIKQLLLNTRDEYNFIAKTKQ